MLSSRAWSSMYTSWNYETGFVWVHFWKIQSSNHPLKTLQKSVFNVLNCTFFSTRRKPGFKSSYQRAGRENHIPLYYNGTPCPIPRVTRIGEIYACQTCVHSRILYFQTQFNPIVVGNSAWRSFWSGIWNWVHWSWIYEMILQLNLIAMPLKNDPNSWITPTHELGIELWLSNETFYYYCPKSLAFVLTI